MPEIKIAVGLVIVLTVIGCWLTNRITLIEGAVFLLPFRAISFDLGLSFSVGQVLIFFVLLQQLVQRFTHFKFYLPLILYLSYCVLLTVILSNGFIEFIDVKFGNYLRQEGRYLSQIVLKVFFIFGVFFAIHNAIDTRGKVVRLLRVLLSSILILCLLGLLQFVVYLFFQVDLFPIPRLSNLDNIRSSVFREVTGVAGWIRVCSFGGEPKGLAAIASIGALLYVVVKRFTKDQIVNSPRFGFAVCSVVVLLTLSTGGFVLLLALMISAYLLRLILSRFDWNFFRASILIPLVVISSLSVAYWQQILEVVNSRIINRISTASGGGIEDFDQTIINFLAANPDWMIFGSGWGNIHNLTQSYIPEEFRYYMANTVFVSKSGYLQVISETGIIGFSLLCFFEFSVLSKLYKRIEEPLFKIFFTLVLCSFIAFLIRANYVVYEYVVVHALAVSLVYAEKWHADKVRA